MTLIVVLMVVGYITRALGGGVARAAAPARSSQRAWAYVLRRLLMR